MSATSERHVEFTEDAPRHGVIRHTRYSDLALCDILRWEEDGLHVVRAADFDLLVVADDPTEATQKFVGEVHSLFVALGELMQRGEATDDEQDLYVRLGTPLIEAFQRDEERRQTRLVAIAFPRFRRRGSYMRGDWRSGSSPARPKRPSIA